MSNDLVYRVSVWDEWSFDRFLQQNQKLEQGIQRISEHLIGFDRFAVEVFHRLFSVADPLPADKIRPECRWALKVHERLSEDESFQEMTWKCIGDRYLAGVGATHFVQALIDKFPPPKNESQFVSPDRLRQQCAEKIQARKQAKKAIEQIAEQVEQLEQGNGASIEENQEAIEQIEQLEQQRQQIDAVIEDLSAEIAQIREQGKAAVEAALAQAQKIAPELSAAVSESAQSASQEVQHQSELLSAFDMGGQGNSALDNPNHGSLDEKIALSKKLDSKKLEHIMEWYGRLKPIAAKKQRSKNRHTTGEIDGLELGGDISRLLPTELMMLDDDDFFPLAAAKIADGSALQYAKQLKVKQGKGSILILLDSTGSMSQYGREDFSKAVALCVVQIAMRQKRHVRILHWGAKIHKVHDFQPRDNSLKSRKQLADAMQYFAHADSTQATIAIDAAVEHIQSEQNGCSRISNADLLFITDGGFSRHSEINRWVENFQKAKKQLGFSLYTLAIDRRGDNNSAFQAITEPDKTVFVDMRELYSDASAIEQIFGM